MSASSAGNAETCDTEVVFPGRHYVTRAFLEVEPQSYTKSPPSATSTPTTSHRDEGVNNNHGFSQVEDVFENDDDMDGLTRSGLLDQLAQKQELIRHLETVRVQYEHDISSLTAEIESLVAASEQAAAKEVDLERTLQDHERQHVSLRRERDELQESLVQTEAAKQELRAQVRVLEGERTTLQRELDIAEEKMTELSEAVCSLQNKLLQSEEKAAELHREVQQLQQQNLQHSDTLSQVTQQMSRHEREIADKAEEIEHAREQANLDRQQLQGVIEGLKRQLVTLSASTHTLTNGNPVSHNITSVLDVSTNEEDVKLQSVLFASFLNNNSYLNATPLIDKTDGVSLTSLEDEIHALRDPGALPVGMTSLETLTVQALVEKMLEEREMLAERHCLELAPRVQHLTTTHEAQEFERHSQLAKKLIDAVHKEQERLTQILVGLLPSKETLCEDISGEEPCYLVEQLVSIRAAVTRATESLSERMGGLELQQQQQVTYDVTAEGEVSAQPAPATTTAPSSLADGSVSLPQHTEERTCSEASWSRGGGSGHHSLHPIPLRDISIEGSDAVSCAGSQLDRDTCSHVTPERIKCQVHRELAALQSQINKSLEVLAALTRSSDLLSVFKEPVSESQQTDAVSAASGQEDAAKDASLQASGGMGCTHQLAKSCPVLALQLSTATQTEDLQNHQRIAASTGDVKRDFGEPSPKRYRVDRSYSYVTAIQSEPLQTITSEEDEQLIVESEVIDDVEDEDDGGSVFENRRESLDLDEFSCRVTEEHPAAPSLIPVTSDPVNMEPTNGSSPITQEQSPQKDGEENGSPERPPSLHPRLRSRGSIPGVSSVIQRSVAVDLEENDDHSSNNQQNGVSPGGKRVSVAFPSLPEAFLRQMGLHRDSQITPESLPEHDVENKFTRLSLAFKTDKLTLENRLSNQQRQRDDAERNVAREVAELRSKLNRLQRLCQESETIEELSEVQRQVDALAHSTESVSRAAEMYGAVQQEERVARAVDVILAHVENLRRIHSKEHAELEEAKRLLQEAVSEDRPGEELPVGSAVRGAASRLRPQQLQSVQASSRRRASIAALPRSASPAEQRFASAVDATRMRATLRSAALDVMPRRTSSVASALQRSSDTGSSTDTNSTESTSLALVRRDTMECGELELQNSVAQRGINVSEQALEIADLSEGDVTPPCSDDEELAEDELHDCWDNCDLRHRRTLPALLPAPTAGNHLSTWLSPSTSFRCMWRGTWRRVASLRWPWSTEQSVLMLRRGATCILLVLAVITMLLVLVPTSIAVSRGARVVCWSPLRIEAPADFRPGLGVELRRDPPPT